MLWLAWIVGVVPDTEVMGIKNAVNLCWQTRLVRSAHWHVPGWFLGFASIERKIPFNGLQKYYFLLLYLILFIWYDVRPFLGSLGKSFCLQLNHFNCIQQYITSCYFPSHPMLNVKQLLWFTSMPTQDVNSLPQTHKQSHILSVYMGLLFLVSMLAWRMKYNIFID